MGSASFALRRLETADFMPRKHRLLVRVLGSLLLLSSLPSALPQSAPTSANTITVTTRLIYVDVVVRDSNGNPLPGLTKEDFTVKEDGKPQPIVFFDDGSHRAGTPLPTETANTPARPGALHFSNVGLSTSTDRAANLVLLDLLNTPQSDQLYAVRQLLTFLKTLPPGHQMALFLLTDRLEMLQGLTGSSEKLAEAARGLDPKDLHVTRSESERMQMVDIITNFSRAMGHDPGGLSGRMMEDLANEDADSLDRRVRITANALAQIGQASSGYPGRKNLLWLGENFPLGLTAQLQLDRSPLSSDVLGTTSLIANLGIAVYPISLAGLQTEGIDASVSGAGETSLMTGAGATLRDQFNARNSMYASMDDLARDTGGKAFHGSNDIAGALSRVIDDGLHYYTLAYRSPVTRWDGTFRHISVHLDKPGYQLTYRHGYTALPEADGTRGVDQELKTALEPQMLDSSQLRLSGTVLPSSNRSSLAVDTTLNAGDLTFKTDPAGHRHTQVLVTLVAFSRDKTAKPLGETTGVLNVDLDNAQYAALLKNGLQFREQLALKPGQYDLRLGVAETGTHRIGTLGMPVTIAGAATASAK